MNSPFFGKAMHDKLILSGTGHSESADPVDASICLILLLDITKRWLLNQRRPVLHHRVTLLGCTRASGHCCCPRLERNGQWLLRCDRLAENTWLLSPIPLGGQVFVLACELQFPRWRLSGYPMQRRVESSRARNRRRWCRNQNWTPCARRLFRMSARPTQTCRPHVFPPRSICHPWTQRDTAHAPRPLLPFVCRLPLATFERRLYHR
jgi:hypothetical protein